MQNACFYRSPVTTIVGHKQVTSNRREERTKTQPDQKNTGHHHEHKRKNRQEIIKPLKKIDTAKLLVNVAEYSQAMTSFLSNGTAPITATVLQQL